jgi:hypothetical protein
MENRYKCSPEKGFISNGTKFENGTRLNREPMELFEEWQTNLKSE